MVPVPTEVVLEKSPAKSVTVTVTITERLIVTYEVGEILEMLSVLRLRAIHETLICESLGLRK